MFRFSIRELFLLVAIAALCLGWWLDHRRHAQAALEARALAEFYMGKGERLLCSQEGMVLIYLLDKYGVLPASKPEFMQINTAGTTGSESDTSN